MHVSDHIYDEADGVYTPTEWAGSPWSKRHQHGGPINALFAKAAEDAALADRKASMSAWVHYARALLSTVEFRFID